MRPWKSACQGEEREEDDEGSRWIHVHGIARQVYERARARYGDDAPSSMPAKLMEEDCGEKLQAPGFEGFTYQDRTSNWDRRLKGGPRPKL